MRPSGLGQAGEVTAIMAEGRLPWTLPDAASYSAIAMHNGGFFARREIRMFTAEVLPGNFPMLKVFEQSGLPIDVQLEPEGVRVTLGLS